MRGVSERVGLPGSSRPGHYQRAGSWNRASLYLRIDMCRPDVRIVVVYELADGELLSDCMLLCSYPLGPQPLAAAATLGRGD